MARIDRFMIAPLNGGAQTDVKPWLIPDDAYASLNNAYVFRGRLVKRFGAKLMQGATPPTAGYEQLHSRLRINIGMLVSAAPNNINTLLGTVTNIAAPGQIFSMGDRIFTIYQANGNVLTTDSLITGVMDTATGIFTFTGILDDDFYFYPSLPVMGIINYEQSDINFEPTFAFDTRFAYEYFSGGWRRLGNALWSGSNSQFYWGYNWRGITNDETFLFVTNYKKEDLIKYYNPNAAPVWANLSPVCNNTSRLLTARIVIPFKDRLVMLNTIEQDLSLGASPAVFNRFSATFTNNATGNFNQTTFPAIYGPGYAIGDQFIVGNTIFVVNSVAAGAQALTVYSLPGAGTNPTATFDATTGNLVITGNGTNLNLPVYYFSVDTTVGGSAKTYVNRCRFSLNGDPTRVNGWIDQSSGLGGYIDAPTKEAIITAQFLKDRLIVYFESSTWELVYIGNQVLPFVWQQINTELGAESTFSQVPFDKVVLGVGNVGIHACNGTNVERIDDKIPDTVFDIHNTDSGPERVYGIRDYFTETVYWAFPESGRDADFPYNNKILVYNYKNGTWAFNDDSITAFGYYQSSVEGGITWGAADIPWGEATFPWGAPPLQGRFRNVLAGNQEGFVFIVVSNDSNATNCPSLQITDIDIATNAFKVIDHNLRVGDYIKIESVQGTTGANGIVQVAAIDDIDSSDVFFAVTPALMTGIYTGGGTITKVTPIDIRTKQYNFYAKDGRNASISKIDFLVLKTQSGQFTVDYFVSTSAQSSLAGGTLTGALLGSGTIETTPYDLMPQEEFQERLWHPIYPMADGECIQMRLYLTEDQTLDADIADAGFEIHAFTIYATPTSSRLQ